MNQVVQLTGVETKKTGTNKRGPWALRLFTTAGGTKFQTFDVDLGSQLEGLVGSTVEVTYEVEDNGNFQNNKITAWKETSETPTEKPAASQDEFRRSKEEIRRTEAVKAAATILASPNYEGDLTIDSLSKLVGPLEALIENGVS